MRRLLLALVSLLAISQAVSAWGPQANKMLCQGAVEKVWGASALACLDEPTQYCQDLGAVLNDSMRQQCQDAYAAGVEIYPANAPITLFNDVENQYNYDNCPLEWVRENNKWICSGKGNPAREQALNWFNAAGRTDDVCRQVRLFCTGGFYYASSFFPLHRVMYLQGCLNGPFDDLVDRALTGNQSGWTVSEQCTFSYMKPFAGVTRQTTQHVTFVLNEGDFEAVLSNLTVAAEYVRNPQLMPVTTTSTTSTTTTATTTSSPVTSTSSTQTTLTTATTLSTTTTTSTLLTSTSTSTTQQEATTTLAPTTTTLSPPTTSSTTTTSTSPSTSTTQAVAAANPLANQSLQQIDNLFGDLVSSINQTQPEGQPKTSMNSYVMFGVMAAVAALSILLLVYLYSAMRRPTIHSSRKVILPPSVRRKMRKAP